MAMIKNGRLSSKAAETRHLLPLAKISLTENQHLLSRNDVLLKQACDEHCKVHDVMQFEPRQMSADGIERAQRSALRLL
eukprot:3403894-Pyramimonas_sp.AAC.1